MRARTLNNAIRHDICPATRDQRFVRNPTCVFWVNVGVGDGLGFEQAVQPASAIGCGSGVGGSGAFRAGAFAAGDGEEGGVGDEAAVGVGDLAVGVVVVDGLAGGEGA